MVFGEVIQGKTVRLRSIEERDAEATFKMRSDPEKSKFIHPAKGTVEDQRQFIRKQRETPGDYLFVIEDLEGNPIGMKGLYNYNAEEKSIESGRFMGFGSQVQNIEALMLSIDLAFDKLGVNTIYMAALENNSIMLGIQMKLGTVYTHREKLDDLNTYNVHSYLTRELYAKNRANIMNLVQRFANR